MVKKIFKRLLVGLFLTTMIFLLNEIYETKKDNIKIYADTLSVTLYHTHQGTSDQTTASGCYNEAYTVSEKHTDRIHESGYEFQECNACGFQSASYATSCAKCGCTSLTYRDNRVWRYVDRYVDVTRYKCTTETTHSIGSLALSASGNNLTVLFTPVGSESSVTGYQWVKDSTNISGATTNTCTASTLGVYQCKVTYKDTKSGYVGTATLSYTFSKTAITFNANGGSCATSSSEYDIGSAYGTLPSASKTGYTFNGWYTAQTGGTQITTASIVPSSPTTLYAQYTANTNTAYKVNHYKLNLDGTTYTLEVTENRTGTSDASLTLSTLVNSYEGFTYSGGAGGTTASTTKPATLDTTTTVLANGTRIINLYYTRNQYAVTLNKGTNVSTVTGSGTYYYGATVNISATINTGYQFVNWTGTTTYTTNATSFAMPAGAVTLTANTSAKTFTVTFNSNGGDTPSSATKTVTYASTYGTLPTVSRTGYTFNGWYTASTGGTEVKATTAVTNASDHTLYAQYTANTNIAYKVNHYKLNLDGTTYTLEGTENRTGTSDASLTLSALANSYEGFTYAGGVGSTSASTTKPGTLDTTTTVLPNGTRVINLYYTRNQYAVTLNKGTNVSAVTGSGTYYYGATVNISATINTGYQFVNWTGTKTYTTNATTFTMPASAVTLTANAQGITYTVSFNSNGGSSATSISVTYGSAYGTLPSVTKTGYTFNGWYTAQTGGSVVTATTLVATASNHTLYAQYTANTNTAYKVNHYKLNLDGTTYTLEETENRTGTSDASLTLSTLANSYEGFTYDGGVGSTSASATKPATLNTTTTVLPNGTRVINLYYTRNQYAVTVNKGTNISTVSGSGTYYYGATVSVSATANTGYNVSGFTGTLTLSGTPKTFTMPASAVTLTANASAKTFTVTFDSNGGYTPSSATKTVTYASTYGTLPTVNRLGYTFNGWYTAQAGGTAVTETTTVTTASNHTLYAHYTAKTDTLYTTNHYGMNLDGTSYEKLNTYVESGESDSILTISDLSRNYEGFTFIGGKVDTEGNLICPDTFDTTTTILPNGIRVINLYYTRNQYAVTLNKGTNVSAVTGSGTYYYGATVNISATINTGYQFVNWTGTTTYTTNATSFTMPASAVTLTANTSAKTFTVTFNSNGGETPSSTTKTVTYASTYGTLPTVTRTGYTFKGWYTAPTGGTEVKETTTVTNASNHTLYAQYTANTNTIYITNHYEMNLDGTSYSKFETNYHTGKSDLTLTISDLSHIYEGFTFIGGKADIAENLICPDTFDTTATILPDGTRIINLYYERNKYDVTLNKGTGISAVTGSGNYFYGASVNISSTVSAGFSFKDWTGTKTYTTNATTFTMPATNVTLTANTNANSYTVTFDSNGGGTPSSATKSVSYNSAYGTLPTVSKVGYGFEGWYTLATGGTKVTSSTIVTNASNHTLYAHYSADANTAYKVNHYKMKLDGSTYELFESDDKTGVSDSSVLISDLKNVYGGFTFKGGKSTTSGTTTCPASFDTDATILSDGSRVINIYYQRNKYDVTLNKGIGISSVSGSGNYFYEEEVNISANVSEGYEFANWTGTSTHTTSVTTFTMPATNVTLTANTNAKEYTVTFNSNGGNTPSSNQITVTYNSAYGTLPTVSKVGYGFEGWYTAADGGTKVTSSTVVTTASNHTLYAHYSANTNTAYKVNHYKMKLDGSSYELDSSDNKTGTSDSTITISSLKNTYEGFTFKGGKASTTSSLSCPDTFDDNATILPDGTRIINLYYQRNKYEVTLTEGTGISNVSGSGNYYYGASVNISSSVKEGYEFENWTGTNTYTDNNKTFTMPDSNVTLQANAKAKTFIVSFDSNGGNAVSDITVTYDDKYPALTIPTKEGYNFKGWFDNENNNNGNGNQIKENDIVKITSDITLHAKWGGNDYILSFNTYGGSAIENKTITFNDKYGTLNNTQRAYSKFEGWYDNVDAYGNGDGTLVTSEKIHNVASDVTINAKWSTTKEQTLNKFNDDSITKEEIAEDLGRKYLLDTIIEDETYIPKILASSELRNRIAETIVNNRIIPDDCMGILIEFIVDDYEEPIDYQKERIKYELLYKNQKEFIVTVQEVKRIIDNILEEYPLYVENIDKNISLINIGEDVDAKEENIVMEVMNFVENTYAVVDESLDESQVTFNKNDISYSFELRKEIVQDEEAIKKLKEDETHDDKDNVFLTYDLSLYLKDSLDNEMRVLRTSKNMLFKLTLPKVYADYDMKIYHINPETYETEVILPKYYTFEDDCVVYFETNSFSYYYFTTKYEKPKSKRKKKVIAKEYTTGEIDEEGIGTHIAFMNGYKDGTFKPLDNVTRSEAVAVITRLCEDYDSSVKYDNNLNYIDINDKNWAKNEIGYLTQEGIIEGYKSKNGMKFKPNEDITRAEIATMIYNLFDIKVDYVNVKDSGNVFKDTIGRWYSEAANFLGKINIFKGDNDGNFRGSSKLTRAELASIINNLLERDSSSLEVTSELETEMKNMFSDVSKDKWYYQDIIEATVKHKCDTHTEEELKEDK